MSDDKEWVEDPETTGSLEDAGEVAILEEEQAMRERLRVDPNALTEDMVRCPGDMAYIGARAARAALAHGRAKIRVKKMRALTYLGAKDRAVDMYGEKKATVDAVNALVESDPDYLAALDDEVVAEVQLAVAKSNVEASKARRDMIVQLGATQRAEMERDPVVRHRKGGED